MAGRTRKDGGALAVAALNYLRLKREEKSRKSSNEENHCEPKQSSTERATKFFRVKERPEATDDGC